MTPKSWKSTVLEENTPTAIGYALKNYLHE